MGRTFAAGVAYFGLVFAVGFLLGWVRTFYVAPQTGEFCAVLLETPLMLAASWLACGWVLRRWPVEPAPATRVAMGAIALVLLLLAEAILSTTLAGRSLAEHFRSYVEPPVQAGLVGQLIFAAFPSFRMMSDR